MATRTARAWTLAPRRVGNGPSAVLVTSTRADVPNVIGDTVSVIDRGTPPP